MTLRVSGSLVVDGVIGIARGLGVAVIAEGIETPEELAALRDAGITLLQGNLFGRRWRPCRR